MTIKQFCTDNHITAKVERADSNPHMEQDSKHPMNHWKVTLKRRDVDGSRHQMTLVFSMGMGLSGEPKAADVLNCVISDAAGHVNAGSFEAWAAEYGYDTDSRKAERTYYAVAHERVQLENFLGDLFSTALECEE